MSSSKICRSVALGLFSVVLSADIVAATYDSKPIKAIFPPDSRPCVFFTLEGVAEVDPAIRPNDPWFALPMNYIGFKEIYALLLSSKLTGTPVTVTTNGGNACGNYPTITSVYMP